MSAYDNPAPSILTGEVTEGQGPDQPCSWAYVIGTFKSLGEEDTEIKVETPLLLNIDNLSELEAGAEAGFEFVLGVSE